jgi:predicted DNA-binding transcriptional regulator YafY
LPQGIKNVMATRPFRAAAHPVSTVTFPLATRLFLLLTMLGSGPQKRDRLLRRLGLGVRDFYRDLERLRKAGIVVVLEEGSYALQGGVEAAKARLPFPDPGLTFGEVRQLAKGRTAAHRKLAALVAAVAGGA